MISVIDRTLSVLRDPKGKEELKRFAERLFSMGADVLELSEENYAALGGDLPAGNYVIRLRAGSSPASFPGIKRFVASGTVSRNVVMSEEYYVRELGTLLSHEIPPVLRPVRLSLATPALDFDVPRHFDAIRNTFLGHVEFSPCGDPGVATSLSHEWILFGGHSIVTTLGGVGGYASFEEVQFFLRSIRRRRAPLVCVPPEEIRTICAEAFPDAPKIDAAPLLKIGPSSSIHIIKFKLDQLGIDLTGDEIKVITSYVRAGHRKPAPYLDTQSLIAMAEKFR